MRSTFTPLSIYKGMFDDMGCPSCQFVAEAKFMNMDWWLYPGNQRLPSKTTGNPKNPISRDMERYG